MLTRGVRARVQGTVGQVEALVARSDRVRPGGVDLRLMRVLILAVLVLGVSGAAALAEPQLVVSDSSQQ